MDSPLWRRKNSGTISCSKAYASTSAFRRGESLFSFSLLPWMIAESIYDLTGESLHRAGISLLLADLDNTLIPYGEPLPGEALRQWKEDLNSHGVELFLLSNSRKATQIGRAHV